MICRSAVIPTIIGLGAAAVVAAGGANAVAGAPGEPTLTVSVHPSDTAPTADKPVTITTSANVANGTAAELEIIKVDVTATTAGGTPKVTGGCDADPEPCNLIGAEGALQEVTSVISLGGKAIESAVEVTVTITVKGKAKEENKELDGSGKATVKFAPLPANTPPPSKPPPTKTKTPPPTKTKSSKPSSSSGSGGSGSGSGGSGSSNGGGTSGSGSTGGFIPPAPNSSFDPRNPQVALPPITNPNAPNPSVAPGQVAAPQSRLQGNKSPVAQDLTFERMASTQIAWLAALMVAFSLLLTQARLGRKRLPAETAKRTKGEHRRPRRGSFGK
ncbi:hypothetical protein E1287_38820 [Actinomadura sp. KC06]|uniref:hypothetical protein n=1 Tax=Actinomadura sp. KC06 TaxID=2530369 RepID=UPI001044C7FD|nr:hypothetical protein [Actinomadura sp. KC06]TDD23625.1 hypothetical protein E1287_38820 [Actinomadura sp. KC06]